MKKPHLSFWQIVNMNVGFFGIQFSFGLQQSNMSPIYQYLGANEASLPLLWLAGPMTGLLVQPIVGAMSDRTTSRWGRRTPYFLIGAILCSLGLLIMPFSPALWFAAGLLWILDAANNVTMEPYRAYVSDRLNQDQHSLGYLTQSAFTGLAQTLAYLAPTIFVLLGMNKDAVGSNHIPQITIAAFMVGALLSFTTVYWSIRKVPELPMDADELAAMKTKPKGVGATLAEIWDAAKTMPPTMRRLAWMALFQWYGMMCYWIYIVPCLAKTMFATNDPTSQGFRDAGLLNGQIGGFYNFVAFIAAFAMVPVVRRIGPKPMHSLCLVAASVGHVVHPDDSGQGVAVFAHVGCGPGLGQHHGQPLCDVGGQHSP
jgi:maltose/moltooligosaccharide transporter